MNKIYIDKEEVKDNEYLSSDIEEVIFSSRVRYVGNCAFKNCRKLKKVIFEGERIELGYECFIYCKSLERIILPKMTHIPYRCFAFSGLKEIIFPDNLISIDIEAFILCKFTNLDFPESLKSIGSFAFYGSGKYETIDFKNIEHIGDSSFQCCKIDHLSIGRLIDLVPCHAFSKCDLKYVEILDPIPRVHGFEQARDGILLDHFSFDNNPHLTVKFNNWFNYKDTTFYVNDHPFLNIYIDDPYKDMKLLFPKKHGPYWNRLFNGKEIKYELY